MTRGEAVNWLTNIMADIGKAEHRELWHYEQALFEIRELLEAQPEVIACGSGELIVDATGDLVSRQAAIDALHTWFRDGFEEDRWWNSTHVLAAIEGLPSVQQEHKWETCFDCPLSHGCPKIKGCTTEQAIEYASQIPNDCPLSSQPEIIHCNSCKHWTQTTGKMKDYGLGRCDFHDADLVTCNGFCYWAERRNDG